MLEKYAALQGIFWKYLVIIQNRLYKVYSFVFIAFLLKQT